MLSAPQDGDSLGAPSPKGLNTSEQAEREAKGRSPLWRPDSKSALARTGKRPGQTVTGINMDRC